MNSRRLVLEQLAQAMATGIENTLGRGVDIGLHGQFDDHEVTSRSLPLRALVVTFDGSLTDCIIAVTNMREEPARAAIAAAAVAIATEVGSDATVGVPQAFEFAERDEALEQLEALYEEPTVNFSTPKGDMLIVMGSGLVYSAETLQHGPPTQADYEDEPGMEGLRRGAVDNEFDADGISRGMPAFVTSTPDSPYAIGADANDVAADGPGEFAGNAPGGAGADADFAAAGTGAFGTDAGVFAGVAGSDAGHTAAVYPHMSGLAATAAENAMAAAPDAERWTNLLTGVDVEITAELGRTGMQLGDLASLVEDCVLTLDQLVDEPVTVFVNGLLYASARLVIVGGEYGIEILEVLAGTTQRDLLAA